MGLVWGLDERLGGEAFSISQDVWKARNERGCYRDGRKAALELGGRWKAHSQSHVVAKARGRLPISGPEGKAAFLVMLDGFLDEFCGRWIGKQTRLAQINSHLTIPYAMTTMLGGIEDSRNKSISHHCP